jgi:prevent-host-death family protein
MSVTTIKNQTNLIESVLMKTVTATEASRGFRTMLDEVESGESFTITRDGQAVAEVVPARSYTWASLMEALKDIPPDPESADLTEDILDWTKSLTWENPWDAD